MRLQDILEWSARLAGCTDVPADSQVYLEAPGDVRRVLVGVDIGVAELLFARSEDFDAVIAHHPMGEHARMDFAQVVERQVGQMAAQGIPEDVARAAVAQRMAPRERADHMSNYNAVVDTGRLIGVPFCNVHLACDIIGRQVVVDLLECRSDRGATVGDAVSWLAELPEMKAALAGPEVWLGSPASPLGRSTVAMAGGTNGGHPVFREYFRAGVDTIFAMHINEADLQALRGEADAFDSLVVTGHMATDSIGINAMIRGLEEMGIEVTTTGGVIRA